MYKKELQFAIHFLANILLVIYFLAVVEFIENQKKKKNLSIHFFYIDEHVEVRILIFVPIHVADG